ncbi:hypothetical protein [Sphingomonas sp. Leaf25]|uniref:hypothetical protein n=1 Tax=Sphingomonas sp. Leaf25 TaxID=1735692 RepID=UPI0007004024|nr:hypothetical protein [Sphingomonas sp. Leaf25]KQM96644.1 hypothetical protein ASE78_11740 [Sphingomonas sp. Leaf25]
MKRLAWTAAALMLGACATPQQQAETEARGDRLLASALAGRTPGTPQNCIPTGFIDGPQVIGDSLVYRQNGKRLWRTQVRDRCPFLRDDQIVVSILYGAQVCRNDRFRLIDRGSQIPSGDCTFGTFVPYDKAS